MFVVLNERRNRTMWYAAEFLVLTGAHSQAFASRQPWIRRLCTATLRSVPTWTAPIDRSAAWPGRIDPRSLWNWLWACFEGSLGCFGYCYTDSVLLLCLGAGENKVVQSIISLDHIRRPHACWTLESCRFEGLRNFLLLKDVLTLCPTTLEGRIFRWVYAISGHTKSLLALY